MMSGPHERLQSNQTPRRSPDHVVAQCFEVKAHVGYRYFRCVYPTFFYINNCIHLRSHIFNGSAKNHLDSICLFILIYQLVILLYTLLQAFSDYLRVCPIPGNVKRAVHTCMVAMHEYTDSYFKSRSLRVSFRTGMQRSTYWLHLLYRYGIPLWNTAPHRKWPPALDRLRNPIPGQNLLLR
jgi:hypothetical protein